MTLRRWRVAALQRIVRPDVLVDDVPNGDGTDDIIWRNQSDGRNWAYLMDNGNIQTSRLINSIKDQNWQITDILDLNGDGKDDLFWRNVSSGLTYIYLMDGIAIQQRGTVRALGTDWQNIH